MTTLTSVFIGMLALNFAAELFLSWRQMRCVRANRHAVPAPFAATVSLEDHQKAADYTLARGRVSRVGDAIGAVTLLGWTLAGGLQGLDSFWGTYLSSPLSVGVAVIVSLLLLSSLISLPLGLYRTFGVEARFGFNKTTWKTYFADLAKGTLLTLFLVVPLAYGVLALMAAAGAGWWFYVWLLWGGFQLFLLWLYPAVIAPLFNKFHPLADAPVLQRVQALLDRCGFASRGVFVMDGSRRSSHGNAYFTGLGRNKRVVFFDTLLERLNVDEIEGVLAHELGHFKLRHVTKRVALSFLGSLAGLALLGWLTDKGWFYTGLGVDHPSKHAALLLLVLVAPVMTFFLSPLGAWYSRQHEFEADRFAARWAQATALASGLVKLYRDNASTLTPDPWHSWVYDSHPPALTRIATLEKLAATMPRS